MSKERARRRAEREREAAIVAAARAAEAERRERRSARRAVWSRHLPAPRPRPTGVLAQRRRQQVAVTLGLLFFVNAVVWVFLPGWSPRFLALFVSLLSAPVLYTMLFRRT